MTARTRTWLIVCCGVGLAASAAATYVHYHVLRNPSYTSFCDVSATISCTPLYQSRFGTLWGVPVALLGLLWFVFAALLLLAAARGSDSLREDVSSFLFAWSTLGLAVVLYLAYASFFILKTVCVFCLATYGAVIGLFILSGAASAVPMSTLPYRAARDVLLLRRSPLALALAVFFAAGAGSAVAFFPREGSIVSAAETEPAVTATQDQRSEFERWYTAQPRVPLVVPAEGAKVLIVDFSDFQCPYCRQAYYTLKPILAKYNAQESNTVRLVLKDYPLDSECNPNVQNGGPHPSACEAAVAVRLSRTHGREEAMEEWLFSNQPSLTPQLVRQAAHDQGQVNDFDGKYASTLDLVKSDIAFGHSLGVSATPTLFINGVKIAGVLAPQYFDQAIAYELAHKK